MYLNYYYLYFYRFRLVSPRNYIVILIPTLDKFHKQTNKERANKISLFKRNSESYGCQLRQLTGAYPLQFFLIPPEPMFVSLDR